MMTVALTRAIAALHAAMSAKKKRTAKRRVAPKRKAVRRANPASRTRKAAPRMPNPREIAAAHRESHPYCVEKLIPRGSTTHWDSVGKFATSADATAYAHAYAKNTKYPVRVVKY